MAQSQQKGHAKVISESETNKSGIRSVNLMRKEGFKVGVKFRTSTGEWLVTAVNDLKVMAKPLWRWANGFSKEYFSEDFPSLPFMGILLSE